LVLCIIIRAIAVTVQIGYHYRMREGRATTPATQESSGATRQSKIKPVEAVDTLSAIDLEGLSSVGQGRGYSCTIQQREAGPASRSARRPNPGDAAEPGPILGEPDTLNDVAHTQVVGAELDLQWKDMDSHIELQEFGFSHPPIEKKVKHLTSPSSPSPTTSKAAWTQRWPAVKSGMPAIPEQEDDGAVLEPPPHMPLLEETAEPPREGPPEQVQGLAIEGAL
jgi:hypothetical protein